MRDRAARRVTSDQVPQRCLRECRWSSAVARRESCSDCNRRVLECRRLRFRQFVRIPVPANRVPFECTMPCSVRNTASPPPPDRSRVRVATSSDSAPTATRAAADAASMSRISSRDTRRIHTAGNTSARPAITLNCSAEAAIVRAGWRVRDVSMPPSTPRSRSGFCSTVERHARVFRAAPAAMRSGTA